MFLQREMYIKRPLRLTDSQLTASVDFDRPLLTTRCNTWAKMNVSLGVKFRNDPVDQGYESLPFIHHKSVRTMASGPQEHVAEGRLTSNPGAVHRGKAVKVVEHGFYTKHDR